MCITVHYLPSSFSKNSLRLNFVERTGLCNPSLYINFADSTASFVQDGSGLSNHGEVLGGVQINENSKCGRGAGFTNGKIKFNGEKFAGEKFDKL